MSLFSRTTVIALLGVGAVSLGVTIALTLAGDDPGAQTSAGADGYSASAIGHKGLVQLLEKLGVPVVVSRSHSADKAHDGLLIIAEPAVTGEEPRERLRALVASAQRALVVLPKWYGWTERGKPWIDEANPLPADDVASVLGALGLDVKIARERQPEDWALTGDDARPVLREPQLIVTDALTAVVATRSGRLLLGAYETTGGGVVHVLADPDVLNNAGLRYAENARFAVDLIDELRGGGPVVIDETLHGYAQQPSLMRTLVAFPLVLATLQVVVCALLAVWAAMVRFGPRSAAPPPIAPGKDFLIRNTAALLHYGGHHAHALERYLQLTVGAVRHALHAPSLAPAATTGWLERVREARGGTISLVDLERAVATADTPVRTVEVADQVFLWRMEMMHGARSRS
jgi:hypothetical protein